MLPSDLLRTLRRSIGAPRPAGAVLALAVLALGLGGAAMSPVSGSERGAAAQGEPLAVELERVEAARPVPTATDRPTRAAVEPTAAPLPTLASPPIASAPRADLQAVPPPADPALPAWGTVLRETGLWSGSRDGTLFTKIPGGPTVRVLDRQDGRFRVFYPGDRMSRGAGEAWLDAADLSAIPWPRWIRVRTPGSIVTHPSGDGQPIAELRPGAFVEVVGEARGRWARVFYLGDGRGPSVEGWLAVDPTAPLLNPDVLSSFVLPHAAQLSGGPSPFIQVPYRSQIDGTPYSDANCGPTTVGMVLEAFGVKLAQPDVRRQVLSLQPSEDCDDCGVYIENLAEVVNRHGLKVNKLRDDDPQAFHRWTLDEIRAELRAGRPVIPQVYYRRLPPRANANYYGDHYIVLTGLLGDRFVFNDPVDSDGPGYSRLISADQLDLAMAASDFPYAAFSVGR